MRCGDRNTLFFQAAVKDSRARNRIEKLIDINGFEQFSEGAKGEVASAYFQNLFKSSNPASFNSWFQDFQPRVSEEMNSRLIAVVSPEEIKEAVFSIKPSSAPGADGMSALFFQHYWSIVGKQVVAEVQNFFVNGVLPAEWNFTHLCLIPKIHHPSLMSDLRPISLCSVLYKVVSKVLVGRLKPLLPHIVSEAQTAFVSERLITDNIMIAHELVHSLNTKEPFASGFMAVKSDMSKAYDRVEWSYLRALLLAMGFHQNWVAWIMKCVSTVTFSVLINDRASGLIVPERGLRQGDPLSSFLFVLCTEGLSHLLNRAQDEGKISGFQFSAEGPITHHLLFADDSLFLCKANLEQASVLQNILKAYGDATGQVVNANKSSITFGKKVQVTTKADIQGVLGISTEGGAGVYLGLPECFSGSKIDMLSYIKDRIKNKLSGWFSRTLSQGGKEVMLKTVAMAMPVFAMSCFKFPKSTCANISSAMADFWWSSFEHSSKIHWISWERLCLPKHQGGMGFRDIALFNQALLAKQAWRIIQHPTSLFSRFIKSRYFAGCNFLQAAMGNRPSFGWRSILHGRDLLNRGLVKRVGNGESIRVWSEYWLDDGGMRAPWIKNNLIDINLKVSALIDFERKDWNIDILEDLFFPEDIIKIKANKPVVDVDDFMVWKHNKSGDYSAKSGYWLASQIAKEPLIRAATEQPSINFLKEQVWKLQTEPKIKVFLWKLLSGALPVGDLLSRRGMRLDGRCQVCGLDGESICHVLFSCSLPRQVWALSSFPAPSGGFEISSVFALIHHFLINRDNLCWPKEIRKSFPWILWRIWKNRCCFLFQGKTFSPLDTVEKIKEDVNGWFAAQVVDQELSQVSDPILSPSVSEVSETCVVPWSPPPEGWLKCNVGSSWSRRNLLAGGAWVVRDVTGEVLLHSRRAFSNIPTAQETSLISLVWAVESMRSHKLNKVVFAVEDGVLVGAVNRPKAWPSFRFHSLEVLSVLKLLCDWRVVYELGTANRGASLIARSVTEDCRLHSYVARGFPFWLNGLFSSERVISSM
ncbi:Reverse transcriptase domain [Arabidopsis suecica]|uniref:Reverse transcriptase domain n=1 Tax=Arabidopsis suecica TaxID=45249 RepID=A0A8T2BS84_ARASU|nr:Reverse transcriptase domain [Arabidopsis suecica]